jgi:hypothetical protein
MFTDSSSFNEMKQSAHTSEGKSAVGREGSINTAFVDRFARNSNAALL